MGNQGCCSGSRSGDLELILHDKATIEKHKKIRPLLSDLDAKFASFAGEDGSLRVKDLGDIWKQCAEQKLGLLTREDVQLIEESARKYFVVLDIDHNGVVTYEEFLAYMLGGYEERGPLKNMRKKVEIMLKYEPENLKELVKRFRMWDENGDGFIVASELASHIAEIATFLGEEELLTTSADDVAAELLLLFDCNDDARVDLWEIMAYFLGRRKTPVELLVYDISRGASRAFTPLLMGQQFEAIYHTGVLAFGFEWWYGGKIFRSKPPCSCFGPPLSESVTKLETSKFNPELNVVPLGFTLATIEEYRHFLSDSCEARFVRENYDIVKQNCNTFSDESVDFLTGRHIPDEIRKLPEIMMNTVAAKMLRPFLNQWLGSFGSNDGHSVKGVQNCDSNVENVPNLSRICSAVFKDGTHTIIVAKGKQFLGLGEDHVVACVTGMDEGLVNLRVFDPLHGTFVTKNGIMKDDLEITETIHHED